MSATASVLEAAPTKESSSIVLDVRGLSRSFGNFNAVTDVRFQVRAGQIFGFVGPNGAGKTTTLKMLATLDTPTSGDAVIGGHSVAVYPEKVRPLIGYMPDRGAVFEDTTVVEHLDFFARAYGLKGKERRDRVASVMAFTQLEDLAHKLLTTLSKGMKQRATLARTLLNDPQLLLLDEPADGLDPRARIELRELLKALADQGKAILISSHILTELSEMCDACAIIEQGRILATGDIGEILSQAGKSSAHLDVRIQLVKGPDAEARAAQCERLLLEQAGVKDVRTSGATLRLKLEGDETRANALLKALVAADIPVCAFQLHEANLEDAFMTVTRGRVQ